MIPVSCGLPNRRGYVLEMMICDPELEREKYCAQLLICTH